MDEDVAAGARGLVQALGDEGEESLVHSSAVGDEPAGVEVADDLGARGNDRIRTARSDVEQDSASCE
jgi:hypothetical protein